MSTAHHRLRRIPVRWLVFHKWTRQHLLATGSLVYGEHGLLRSAVTAGHDEQKTEAMVRYVRTSAIDLRGEEVSGLRNSQVLSLLETDRDLESMAARLGRGRARRIASVPVDPLLRSREQLLLARDVDTTEAANQGTLDAFVDLARAVTDPYFFEEFV